MITEIGIVAGVIWSYLDGRKEPVRMDDVIGQLQKERDLVLMSIGWLAREGHIVLAGESPDYTVSLSEGKKEEEE
jgi:hypothetical protein